MTLIDKAEALAPCPFCTEGKTVSTYFDHEQGDKWGYASCDACGARGPEVRTNYDRDDNAPWRVEAIAAWNRRAALPARGVGVQERVQHKKRGSTYRVVGRGKVQTDTPLTDYAEVVVYQCEADGTIWVRPVSEFEDGRFAALAPTDAAQAREAAARLLLDMLHMRNGAHEGVSKEDAQKMWDAASTREGYAAVDAFLRSIIGEART